MREQTKQNNSREINKGERGAATIIALMVLGLLTVFVALALSRSTNESIAMFNDAEEGRAFYAAQASLETMTRNFNKVFETKISPLTSDITAVQTGSVPGFTTYTFNQSIAQTSTSSLVTITGGEFEGLYALRDSWMLRSTATTQAGAEVQLTRTFLNNRIPIFQFGIFYEDDLELFRPPLFSFGGRVHSNRHFFMSPGTAGVYFNSRVTAHGEIITQSWRNGNTSDSGNNQTFIKNASGVNTQLYPAKGSVLNTTAGAADNIFASDPQLPPSKINTNWAADSAVFDGNLQRGVKELKLPLKVGTNTDLIELVKRGKKIGDLYKNSSGVLNAVTSTSEDGGIMTNERFTNKTGIRISLADSKAKLPGCAAGTSATDTNAVTGQCGVRLDGHQNGSGSNPAAAPSPTPERVRGYRPLAMTDGYQATRLNGERFYQSGREVWIKVETVTKDSAGVVLTKDITQDILSLGVTEQPVQIISGGTTYFDINGYNFNTTSGTDSRSIIKLQRYLIPGPSIPAGTGTSKYLSNYNWNSNNYNLVVRYSDGSTTTDIDNGCTGTTCTTVDYDPNSASPGEQYAHMKRANIRSGSLNIWTGIVPVPIEMFDSREGEYYDDAARYTAGQVTRSGVMSMVDIDVANLRRFLNGDFNNLFPTTTPFAASNLSVGLKNTDISSNSGWILSIADRRGDYDFDGEYDMEDIYGANPGNDGILQFSEDINNNSILDVDYVNEAPRYNEYWLPDRAVVTDHKYYRRGVRLVNGTTLPGVYDSVTPSNTKGLTIASENGVYVKGNYNATGVVATYTGTNTPYNEFLPQGTSVHIPAAIVSDAVTVLSNNWNDANSFVNPYDKSLRVATTTTIRFAMIAGDTLSSKKVDPHQGSSTNSERENGGVHNFKRFLETWSGVYLNYAGSLINLFNSRNNNASFKCCNTVYNPPNRNWVFDSTFLDPTRLPPGTPYFQYVQITGFQRTNY